VTVVVPDPELGPDRCARCGAVIVWALSPAGRMLAVDFESTPGPRPGAVELYAEFFYPDGEPVDGFLRVRARPLCRPPEAPSWSIHWEAPRPCEAKRR